MPLNPADRVLSDAELKELFADPPTIPERAVPAFMYDAGMDQRSVALIRQALDLHVTTAQEQGLESEKSDLRVLAHARRFGYTRVVRDRGFKRLHDRLEALGLTHAGIAWARHMLPPERVLAFAEQWTRIAIEKEIANILYYRYWKIG